MILKNLNSKKIISNNIIEAKNLKDKSIGLISKNNNQGVFIKTRFGIHTFFMKYSIDVIILDNNHKVVKIKEGLKPFRIFIWNPKYLNVVEIPSGKIKLSNTKIGDKLDFTK